MYAELPGYLKLRKNKRDLIPNVRSVLWQNVYTREIRDDAQFARVFELLIPSFFSIEEAIYGVSLFSEQLAKEGMIVDAAIHSAEKYSPTNSLLKLSEPEGGGGSVDRDSSLDYRALLMCTMRDYKNGMFLKKNREWNTVYKIENWRKNWVIILNEFLNIKKLPLEDQKHWEHKLSIYHEFNEVKDKQITIQDMCENKINNNTVAKLKPK